MMVPACRAAGAARGWGAGAHRSSRAFRNFSASRRVKHVLLSRRLRERAPERCCGRVQNEKTIVYVSNTGRWQFAVVGRPQLWTQAMPHPVVFVFKWPRRRTVTSSNQDLKGPDFLVRYSLHRFPAVGPLCVIVEEMRTQP